MESCDEDIPSDLSVEAAVVIRRLGQLWMQSHLAASRDCLGRLICEANDELAVRGVTAWTMSEIGRCGDFF